MRHYLARILALGLLYFFTARAGLMIHPVSGFATLVWPPTGISLVALFMFGYRLWPGVALGAFFANLLTGAPIAVAIGIGAANTLEALAGAYWLRQARFRGSLIRIRDALALIILGAILSTLISASMGTWSLWWGGVIEKTTFASTWMAWWIGDALSNLIIAFLLFAFLNPQPSPSISQKRQIAEGIFLGVLIVLSGLIVFCEMVPIAKIRNSPISYIIFPGVIWAALRFGPRGAAVSVSVVSALAIYGTIQGYGPFVLETHSQSLLHLQFFMGLIASTSLLLASAMAERRESEDLARRSGVQLKFQEEQMRLIVNAIPALICYIDLDLRLSLVNKMYEAWSSRNVSELQGSAFEKLFGPECQSVVQSHLKKARSGERTSFESAVDLNGSKVRWLEITLIPHIQEDGTIGGIVALAHDITHRKEFEQQLIQTRDKLKDRVREKTADLHERNRSIQLLHNVASAANQSIHINDLLRFVLESICVHTGWPLGHVYFCEKGILKSSKLWHSSRPERFAVFRKTSEERSTPLGKGLAGQVAATCEPLWFCDINKAEVFLRSEAAKKDGIQSGFAFPVMAGTEVKAVLEFFSDQPTEPDNSTLEIMAQVGTHIGRAFERNENQEQLQESEMRFRSVAESANDAIITADARGKIISWNRAAERIFGYSEREALGKPATILIPERLRGSSQLEIIRADLIQHSFEAGRTFEFEGLKQDESEFPLEISISKWKSADEVFFTGIVRDITTRKQVQQELMRSIRELKQFAYICAHDLQEPLRSITSFSQILIREYKGKLDRRAEELFAYVIDGATRMAALINDILVYSQIGAKSKPPETVDANRILKTVLLDLQKAISENNAAVTSDHLPVIQADPSQFAQIFQNLIGNALKFHGGRIPRIHISASETEKDWVFSIRDNGIGIDPKYAERIFVLFQRLHPKGEYPGTGMGLAICKRIVEQHGGEIWFESEVGSGSVFYFNLPKKPQKPVAA